MIKKNLIALSPEDEPAYRAVVEAIIKNAPEDSMAVLFLKKLQQTHEMTGVAAFLDRNLTKDGNVRQPLLVTKQEFALLDELAGGKIGKIRRRNFISIALAGFGMIDMFATQADDLSRKMKVAKKRESVEERSQEELIQLNNLPKPPENYENAVNEILRRRQESLQIIDNEIAVIGAETGPRRLISGLALGVGWVGHAASGNAGFFKDRLIKDLSRQFVAAFGHALRDPDFLPAPQPVQDRQ